MPDQLGTKPQSREEAEAEELIARVAAGERAAWDEVVERYAGLVWAVARAQGLGAAEAADVSQLTWLRLLEHASSLRQPARVGSWLATTARREAQQLRRLRRREIPVADDTSLDRPDRAGLATDTELLRAERDAALRAAFVTLPDRCRQLLRLLVADPPMSYAEISAALPMPVGSIGPTRARCLECLRRRADWRRFAES